VGKAWDEDRDEPGKTLAVYNPPYLSKVTPRASCLSLCLSLYPARRCADAALRPRSAIPRSPSGPRRCGS
jgi:hypothetical protein